MLVRLLLLSLFLGPACADPAKDKAKAVVEDPPAKQVPVTTAAEVKPAQPAMGSVRELTATGSIGFVGAKVTKSHDGAFKSWTAQLRLAGERLDGVDVEVQVGSVETGVEKLDGHLKSPDFFDAENIRVASFHSTEVRPTAPADSKLAGANITVVGDLSIHGVTKRVEVPGVLTLTPERATATTEFSINRQDFGVTYPGKPDDLIRDDVLLKVNLYALRAPAVP